MPRHELETPHRLTPEEARARLDKARVKLETDYGATCAWKDERLLVTRKGLTATVRIDPASLHVDLELGMLMNALSGAIKAGITKQLTDLLACPSSHMW